MAENEKKSSQTQVLLIKGFENRKSLKFEILMAKFGFAFFNSGIRFGASNTPSKTTMIRLTRFIQNPFDDRNISVPEMSAYTTDHLQRMIASNPGGILTARITATTSTFGLFQDAFAADLGSLGVRMASVQVKNNFRSSLPGALENLLFKVGGQYGAQSAQVTTCFPQGRTAITKAADDQLKPHLDNLIDRLATFTPAIQAGTLAEAEALRDNWVSVYNACEASTGAKTSTEEAKRNARFALATDLYLNVIEICRLWPREEGKITLYTRQSLLEDHPSGGDDEEEEEPEPPPAPEE